MSTYLDVIGYWFDWILSKLTGSYPHQCGFYLRRKAEAVVLKLLFWNLSPEASAVMVVWKLRSFRAERSFSSQSSQSDRDASDFAGLFTGTETRNQTGSDQKPDRSRSETSADQRWVSEWSRVGVSPAGSGSSCRLSSRYSPAQSGRDPVSVCVAGSVPAQWTVGMTLKGRRIMMRDRFHQRVYWSLVVLISSHSSLTSSHMLMYDVTYHDIIRQVLEEVLR